MSTPAADAPDELTEAERTAKRTAEPTATAKRTNIRLSGLLAALFMLAFTLACNVSDLILPATPTPVPTRALAPTWTPTPESLPPLIVVTPPQNGTPGVIIIQPTVEGDKIVVAIPPTDTPVPPPTPTFTPTPTPNPFDTPTPLPGQAPQQPQSPLVPGGPETGVLPTPTPLLPPTPDTAADADLYAGADGDAFILVESGYVALRTGPGPDYPLVAQLGPNIPIAIISRNPEGTWYEICCVNGFSVWVASSHVRVVNDPGGAPLVVAQGPPSPTPSFTPTLTPTPTPDADVDALSVRARHRAAVLPDGQPVPDHLGKAVHRPGPDRGAGGGLLCGRQIRGV